MQEQTYTDPATGRRYTIDPATGQSRWVDQPSPPPVPPSPSPMAQLGSPFAAPPMNKPKTVSGIVGLVVSVIALLLSWVPIVNNIAAFFAVISLILGVVALVATRPSGKKGARWAAVSTLVLSVLAFAVVIASQAFYGKVIDTAVKSIDTSVGTAAPSAKSSGSGSDSGQTEGTVKFGGVVTFKDGSTLGCGKPVTFKRDQFAAGGEKSKTFLKVKCTFTNHSGKTFEPALTTGSMTADSIEGESVFQQGLDAPDNPVLNGKSVTWWMGYGLASSKDVQLTVRLGFLDYDSVTFT